MFRRFMIVCWVLFALFASLACVGAASSRYHAYKILNISDPVIKPEHDEPIEMIQDLQYGLDAVAELIRRHELREQQIADAPPLPEGYVIVPPTLPIEEIRARREVLSEKLSMGKRHEWKIDGGNSLAMISGFSALVVLLWNIIWHTGHWIWMGRKAE